MPGRFSVDAVFRAVDLYSRPIARMQSCTRRFTRGLKAGMRGVMSAAGSAVAGLRKVGVAAGIAAAAVGLVARDIIKTGSDFEQAITNVGAVSLKSRDQIAELETQAKQLGATTKFTATEVASGMEIMAKAGFSTADILKGIPGVLDAAAASGLELAEVSNVVSNALKGFGMDASKAGDVADILALASSKTNSTIGTLGESLKNVSATARQLNIPIEDATAAVALLQDVGLDASVAGSSLNTMMTRLSALTPGVTAKLKKYGVTFKDASGNALPFAGIMANVSKAVEKAGGNMDQVKLIAEAVGLRGQKAALALQNMAKTGRLAKLTEELGKARGSAKKMAEIRMDTLQGDWLLLKSAVDAVKVSMFEVKGPLRAIVKATTDWVTKNEKAIAADFSSFVEQLTILTELFGGEFLDTLETVTAAWGGMNDKAGDAETIAQSPMWRQLAMDLGAIAGALAAAIIGFGKLVRIAVIAVTILVSGFKEAFGAIIDDLGGVIFAFIDMFKDIAAVFRNEEKSLVAKMAHLALALFRGFGKAIKNSAKLIWDAGTGFAKNFLKGLKEGFKSRSPSRKMEDEALNATRGFERGIKKGIPAVDAAMQRMTKLPQDIANDIAIAAPKLPRQLRLVHSVDRVGGTEDRDGELRAGLDNRALRPELASVTAAEVARSVSETNTTSNALLTVRDETGRAELTQDPKNREQRVRMAPTGTF